MNSETKQRIANLPDVAADAVILAAWANVDRLHEAWMRSGRSFDFDVFPSEGSNPDPERLTQSWVYMKDRYWTRVPHSHGHGYERTLRRWLLDVYDVIYQFDDKFPVHLVTIGSRDGSEEHYTGEGDSPEAAFTNAIETFAKALREES